MDQKIKDTLGAPQSEFHDQMLKECCDLLKISRSKMSKKYKDWDLFQQVYMGERLPDEKDIKARDRKEPEKMVVPMTFAQVQTFIAFCFQLFTQRPNFYELVGMGVEDWKPAKIAEALLQRDLTHNKFIVTLYQLLLNIARFGLGVMEHTWTKEMQKQWVNKPRQPQASLSGVMMNFGGQETTLEDVVKFLGNKVRHVSPYRFFPDPRVSINDFQEGEFCASEIDVTHMWLKKQEKNGMLQGVDNVKDMPSSAWEWRTQQGLRSDVQYDRSEGKQKGGVIFTKVQREIIPNKYEMPGGGKLGQEDYPIKYIVCIANDNRIVKCEPMNYLHDNYTYSAAQLSPDDHVALNAGVAELVNELQSTITWLLNSRITSVRKIIQDRLIVDPEGVEMSDVNERKSIIRLKKGAARSGVERWIQQLDVKDVTATHVTDAQALGQIMQLVTGINENALGQYSQGRRSAEQTKAVNAGASSRLKMYASLIWVQSLQPLGEDMLSNLRDGLDVEQMVRVLGMQTLQPQSPYAVNARDMQQFLGVTKSDLVGNYDFEMLDGTLPSEKGYTASQLQEILVAILTNPQAAAVLGLDARALMTEIAELQDIRNPERFFMQPAQQQAIMAAAQQVNKPEMALPAGSAQITSATAGQPQNAADLMGGAALPQLQLQ